jgi:hypothetical protein
VTAALLETPRILFNGPDLLLGLLSVRFAQGQVARGPELGFFHIGIDQSENADQAAAAQMHNQAFRRDRQQMNRSVARIIGIDRTVALNMCEPVPSVVAHGFEIVQAAIPTVKAHQSRRKAALLGGGEHMRKCWFLSRPSPDLCDRRQSVGNLAPPSVHNKVIRLMPLTTR